MSTRTAKAKQRRVSAQEAAIVASLSPPPQSPNGLLMQPKPPTYSTPPSSAGGGTPRGRRTTAQFNSQAVGEASANRTRGSKAADRPRSGFAPRAQRPLSSARRTAPPRPDSAPSRVISPDLGGDSSSPNATRGAGTGTDTDGACARDASSPLDVGAGAGAGASGAMSSHAQVADGVSGDAAALLSHSAARRAWQGHPLLSPPPHRRLVYLQGQVARNGQLGKILESMCVSRMRNPRQKGPAVMSPPRGRPHSAPSRAPRLNISPRLVPMSVREMEEIVGFVDGSGVSVLGGWKRWLETSEGRKLHSPRQVTGGERKLHSDDWYLAAKARRAAADSEEEEQKAKARSAPSYKKPCAMGFMCTCPACF